MVIDFSNLEIKDIEGNIQKLDISKTLGNAIFNNTQDLGELEIARTIYKEGSIVLDKAKADMIKGYVDKYFMAVVKESVLPVLNSVQ